MAIPRRDGGARDTVHSSLAVCIELRDESDRCIELSYTFVRSSFCFFFRYFSTTLGGRLPSLKKKIANFFSMGHIT